MCVSWQLSGFDSAISGEAGGIVVLLQSSLPKVLLINVCVCVCVCGSGWLTPSGEAPLYRRREENTPVCVGVGVGVCVCKILMTSLAISSPLRTTACGRLCSS